MAVEHIKIHQIHESQTLKIPSLQSLGKGDAIGVAGGLDLFGHTLAVKNIVDLAHSDHVLTGVFQQIQHGGAGRLQAQVVAVGGAVKGVGTVAKEGAGDHTTHAVLALEHFPGDLTVAVQLVHRHQFFVGSHLKNAVSAGVDDEGVFPHGLFAIVLQYLRAGIGLVAQYLMAGFLLVLPDQLLRKALGEGGQRLRADYTGDLPVADGGILAHALLLQAGKGSRRGIRFLPCGHAVNVEQTQLTQIGAIEIGVVRNGTQGVGACIAKGSGVRLCANAKAVQNDQKNAFFHNGHSISPGRTPEQYYFIILIISKKPLGCKRKQPCAVLSVFAFCSSFPCQTARRKLRHIVKSFAIFPLGISRCKNLYSSKNSSCSLAPE